MAYQQTHQSSTGHMNQWMDTARQHPVATAAAAAGAVAAGVYLWSNRDQVSNQVNKISRTASEMSRRASQKASEWSDRMRSGSSSREVALTSGPNESSAIEASRRTQSRASSARATGGISRTAGQNMNPSRAGAETVGR